jgi:hypothetical protein
VILIVGAAVIKYSDLRTGLDYLRTDVAWILGSVLAPLGRFVLQEVVVIAGPALWDAAERQGGAAERKGSVNVTASPVPFAPYLMLSNMLLLIGLLGVLVVLLIEAV